MKDRQDAKPVLNLAIGPTLHPAKEPSKFLGAALFEILDASNANGRHPSWKDRFSFRLYAVVPF